MAFGIRADEIIDLTEFIELTNAQTIPQRKLSNALSAKLFADFGNRKLLLDALSRAMAPGSEVGIQAISNVKHSKPSDSVEYGCSVEFKVTDTRGGKYNFVITYAPKLKGAKEASPKAPSSDFKKQFIRIEASPLSAGSNYKHPIKAALVFLINSSLGVLSRKAVLQQTALQTPLLFVKPQQLAQLAR